MTERGTDPPFICGHDSASGVDQSDGPDKVFRCDHCGWLYRSVRQPDGSDRRVPVLDCECGMCAYVRSMVARRA